MPVIPAWLSEAISTIHEKLRICLVWKGERHDGEIKEAVRPESWLPYVFTSIDDPRLDEIVGQNHP
jgi:hypothetical protein